MRPTAPAPHELCVRLSGFIVLMTFSMVGCVGMSAPRNVPSNESDRDSVHGDDDGHDTDITGGGDVDFVPGVWTEITPSTVVTGAPQTCIGQGLAIDPNNPAILYWGTTPFTDEHGGLFKTLDGGSHWTKIGAVMPAWNGASDHLNMPLRIRVDPNDSQHLYVGDGVRGSSQGFFISHDGGDTFVKPQGWSDALVAAEINTHDVYDVAVDPTDFDHILVSFHSAWNWDHEVYGQSSGVMESEDGGETWTAHNPKLSWGSGHSINFLYEPTQGIGNADTWLLGTQNNGQWRTTDGGDTWTQVDVQGIFHGGGSIYYANDGVLYATALGDVLRSTNNGATWTSSGLNLGATGIVGDGERIYTGPAYNYGAQPVFTSAETDGQNWAAFNEQKLTDGGPFELVFDPVNRILYSSNWYQGVWAVKLAD